MNSPVHPRGGKALVQIGVISLVLLALTITGSVSGFAPAFAQSSSPTRRVNVPYLGVAPPVDDFTPAIFWLGQVDMTSNYADVRVYYYDDYLNVVVHIIDRRWLYPVH